MIVVFSVEKRRPGCVLLQAVMGGTVPSMQFQTLFPNETWLLSPTDDMKAYSVTENQLEQLSAMALAEVEKKDDVPRRQATAPRRRVPRRRANR